MRDVDTHQTDQVNRRHIIVESRSVLTVVNAAGIAHATLEPRLFAVSLHLDDEDRAGGITAHEIELKFLAVADERPLKPCRTVIDVLNLTVRGKKRINQHHHLRLVVLVPEERLEATVCQKVHIPLLRVIVIIVSHFTSVF